MTKIMNYLNKFMTLSKRSYTQLVKKFISEGEEKRVLIFNENAKVRTKHSSTSPQSLG
jgi:hypothetical protein